MKTKLFQLSSYVIINRAQLQVMLFLVLLTLVVASLVAPGVVALADGPVIGPH